MRAICLILLGTVFGSVSLGERPLEIAQRHLASLSQQPETPSRWVEEARLCYYLGNYLEKDSEKEAAYNRGLEAAKKARSANPRDPGAILWWVGNEGKLSLLKGKLNALFSIRRIEEALLELRAIAPAHFHHAADRILGSLYLEAPPVISVGSKKKAREHFEAAMAGAPQFMGNKARYARFLWETGEKAKARALAREIIESPEMEKNPLEAPEWKESLEPIFASP